MAWDSEESWKEYKEEEEEEEGGDRRWVVWLTHRGPIIETVIETKSQELSFRKVRHTDWTQFALASFLKHAWSEEGPLACQECQGTRLQVGGAKVGAHRDLPVTLDPRPELWGAAGDPGHRELRDRGGDAKGKERFCSATGGVAAPCQWLASATWSRAW